MKDSTGVGGTMDGNSDLTARRVAVLSELYPPAVRGGGPIRTLEALVRRAPANNEVLVLASDTDLGQTEPMDVRSDRPVHVSPNQTIYYIARGSFWSYVRGLMYVRGWRPGFIFLNCFFYLRFSILPQLIS